MKALILAAGKGTRLKEVTENYPKVMMDIGGKPCLEHNIELLKKYEIKDIAINTHHFPEKIIEYFGDGSKFGVSIRYSREPEILGTAGSLNNFRDFFNEDFLVIYGDVLHKTDLKRLIEFHKKNKVIATLALDNRPQKGKGVVILEGERIVKFVEKPEQDISGGLINSGVYALSPDILKYIPEGFSDFGKEIFPKILELGEKLYGFKIGEVIDIGTFEDLEKARKLLSKK